jgi:hypothetical protein
MAAETDRYCARCGREAPRALWDPSTPTDDPSFDDPQLIEWVATADASNPERIELLCPDCRREEVP